MSRVKNCVRIAAATTISVSLLVYISLLISGSYTIPFRETITSDILSLRSMLHVQQGNSSVNVDTLLSIVQQADGLMKKQPVDCPANTPTLVGRIPVNTNVPSWDEVNAGNYSLSPGGRHAPADCKARSRVALIIPYRDREAHLKVLLRHIHPFLQKQQLDYGIYVVELAAGVHFNRGLLMNAGFVEASKIYKYDCLIFHDVDLLPEDDRNLYSCGDMPKHMARAIQKFRYAMPYADYFGGVSAMTGDQFQKINGFSNVFFGWGGEDDDFAARVKSSGLNITWDGPEIARYTMLLHNQDTLNTERLNLLKTTKIRHKSDCLNSLQYQLQGIDYNQTFTLIHVTVNRTSIEQSINGEMPKPGINPINKVPGLVLKTAPQLLYSNSTHR